MGRYCSYLLPMQDGTTSGPDLLMCRSVQNDKSSHQIHFLHFSNNALDLPVLQVTEIKLKYFDTTPVATAMNVLKTGFLFVASEFGNQ